MKIVVRVLAICLFVTHFAGAIEPTSMPTPAPISAPSSSPKTDDKFKDFTKPIFFAIEDSSVKVHPPIIDYELKTDKKGKNSPKTGGSLIIGDFVFNNESLKAQMDQDALHITWDTQLVPGGDLSIIDSYGKELWKVKTDTSGSWKFSDLHGARAPQWKSGDHFRFCLRSEQGKGFVSMCTQTYGIEISSDQKYTLDYTKSSSDPRVIIMNEERKQLKDRVEVVVGTPAQFLGTLQSGATYEFMSEPVALSLKDFIESEQKDMVTFTGELPAPLSKEIKIIPGIEYGKVTKALGFQKTIAEPVDLWKLDIPAKNSKLQLAGKSGGVFTYNLDIISYPKITDRIFTKPNFANGTYKNKDKVVVKVPAGLQVEGLTKTEEKTQEPELHSWEFSAEKKYELNKPELLLKEGTATHHAYLEVYHGTSGELSLRLSALSSSEGGTALLGEVHFQYWFNDLFGWQNDYLSKQRWGVSLKHFMSLQELSAGDNAGGTKKVNLSSTQLDARYRFSQGLWERDETVGLIGSYESLTIDTQKANKLGAGLFWARSMPKVFDNLLNKISWFNYPKFVDMEYIQFFGSTDSGTSIGSDFIVNFHGKIMYTKSFFAEAGFGMKNYNFMASGDTGAKLSTFYATAGVGLDF